MYVVKRNGNTELRDDAKFERQIDWACKGLDKVDPEVLKVKARDILHDQIQTSDLHRAITKAAADLISLDQPQWTYVAARSVLQELFKTANNGSIEYPSLVSYLDRAMEEGKISLKLNNVLFNIPKLQAAVDAAIENESDLKFDYLGIQTLTDRYLLRGNDNQIIELPQHFFMRVAMGVALAEDGSKDKTQFALDFFQVLTERKGSPSTPTLFNSGTLHPQLSSCFGSYMDDSIDGIFNTLAECGAYSKFAGGCSMYVGAIRSQGSKIKTTGGRAGGPIPYIAMYDATLRGFDQSGKRKGVGSFYIDIWHADAFEFLKLKEPGRDPRMSALDTFPAFMIPDLFMERLNAGMDWSLFDPKDVSDLITKYGQDFERAYHAYEAAGLAKRVVPAEDLWHEILTKVYQHGVFWPCFRDTLNRRYTQSASGLIHNSNLCLTGDTLVQTLREGRLGTEELSNLASDYTNVQVLSYNTKTETSEFKAVTAAALMKKKAALMKITDSATGFSIRCTPEHKVWTVNRGYVEAQELTVDDRLYIG